MNKKAKEYLNKRVLWLIALILVVLVAVGILLAYRMDDILKKYETTQVKMQLDTISTGVEESFDLEIRYLEGIAFQIEKNITDAGRLMEVYDDGADGVSYGIIDLKGNAIYGKSYLVSDFECIRESLHGNASVSFSQDGGLMFSVPIFTNGNVRYVFYKLYSQQAMDDFVNLECYGGAGYVTLQNMDSTVLMSTKKNALAYADLIASWQFTQNMDDLRRARNIESSSATYMKYAGEGYFIFQSEIKGEQLMLAGAISEGQVTQNVSYIQNLVIWTYSLMIILFAVVVFYLAIAEYKAEETDELREAKAEAEKASEAKSDFLASMSHEIRTPINAVIGMNEMILRESTEDAILSYAHNIESASNNLLQLINDILDFSKIEAGMMDIVESTYNLGSFLNNMVNMIEIRAVAKDLKLVTDIAENLPVELYGDATRIQQIFLNVLTNAVKYTKEGTVTFRLWADDSLGHITLNAQVEDTGIGIRPEDISKLFDDFTRVDHQSNKNIEGTGLGLAITKQLLEKMNGDISVDSTYGKGSVFTVRVPQKAMSTDCIGDFSAGYDAYVQSKSSYKQSFTTSSARILVVDDNKMNRQVIVGLLKKTGVDITLASGGREALDILANDTFDLVLLDHMMPEIDGIEVLQRYKSDHQYSRMPFIALTANATNGIKDMYLAAGFDDYMSKPFVPGDLEKLLIRYLPKYKVKLTEADEEKTISEQILSQETSHNSLINEALGLEYCGDMEDFYQEMKEEFVAESEEKMKALEDGLFARDMALYALTAHSIKSTSLSIGAEFLSHKAKMMEGAAKSGNETVIVEEHGDFIALYNDVINELKEMRK